MKTVMARRIWGQWVWTHWWRVDRRFYGLFVMGNVVNLDCIPTLVHYTWWEIWAN
jgi:hypothetical protein